MKIFSSSVISAVISFFMFQQANATDIKEEFIEKKETHKLNVPLNSEAEEVLEDVLNFNKLWKKVELDSKSVPESEVLNSIKEHSSQYIKDLKKVFHEVEEENDPLKRKELVNIVHQKNNPFSIDYL